MKTPTILLSRSHVESLLSVEECIHAVENVFRLLGEGLAKTPGMLGIHVPKGGFHTKAGMLSIHGHNYFVTKTNANFPGNPNQLNLPTIQGIIAVSDADNGRLLALVDSIHITVLRTGAATAVAAKYLSKPDAKNVTIIGCGNQGRISIHMLMTVRSIKRVFVYDRDREIASKLAEEMRQRHPIGFIPVDELADAVAESDIIVTCTTSRHPIVRKDWISQGTFIAAVGADSEEKQEIEASLTASCKIVTDLTEQCALIGELHHAIEAGLATRDSVYAELGSIVASRCAGRTDPHEIILFDSTGMALQDVASTVLVYEKASGRSATTFDFME